MTETKILKTSFEDIPDSHPFAKGIRMANQKKWLMPNPQSGAFEPERPVIREELIALLNHTASHTSVSKNSDIASFADAADRPTANALHWARDRNITEPLTGGDKIDPTAPVSHEELAAVLFQYNAEVQLTGMNEAAGSRFRDVLGAGYSAPLRCVGWCERHRAGFFGCFQPDRADYSRSADSFHSPLQAAEPAVH